MAETKSTSTVAATPAVVAEVTVEEEAPASSATGKRQRDDAEPDSEKKPRADFKHPGDWSCPHCSEHCFASRSQCRKCGTTRTGGGGPAARAAGAAAPAGGDPNADPPPPGKYNNPNDWTCPQCSDHVFASRPSCRKCGTSRPHSLVSVTSNVPKKEMRAGDWMCSVCADHNYGSRAACRKCRTPRFNTPQAAFAQFATQAYAPAAAQAYGAVTGQYAAAYGQQQQQQPGQQTPASQDPYAGYNAGYGVAAATGYGTSQTAQYAQYAAPADQQQQWGAAANGYAAQTIGPAMSYGVPDTAVPAGGRTGDWMCPTCSDHCYASRGSCRKCGTTKPGISTATAGVTNPSPGMGRAGDWACPSCGDHCYASRSVCRRCNTAKPTGLDGGISAHASYMTGALGAGPAKPDGMGGVLGGRPGDWICPSCENHCYASRNECYKCKATKPM